MPRSRRFLILLSVLLVLPTLNGCYNYRVTVQHPDPTTEYEQATAHSFIWGLIQKPQYIVANNCRSNAIDEVYISDNYAYTLITVLSLGTWAPIDVQWRCADTPVNDHMEQPL